MNLRLILIALSLGASIAHAQQPNSPDQHVKTAGEAFKNVQVLRRIPADQWFDTMAFIAASLGVTCEHCHSSSFEIDEGNLAKLKARQHMRMVDEINSANFDGKVVVTCNTCHRGALRPQGDPTPNVDHWREAAEKDGPVPSAADVIARYRREVGLASSARSVTQWVSLQVDTFDGTGPAHKTSVEVLLGDAERARVTERDGNKVRIIVKNGRQAWSGDGTEWRTMSEGEASTAFEAAEILDPDQAREFARTDATPDSPFSAQVNGQRAYVVPLQTKDEKLWFYFDADSGLLLRKRIFFSGFYGEASVDIEFADYRKTGGLQLPDTIRVVNAGGAGLTIRRAVSRKVKIPIKESAFTRAGN